MRTTLTLDDDVSVLLGSRQAELSIGFKELVNMLLRSALAAKPCCRQTPAAGPRFSTPVFKNRRLVSGEMTSVSDMLALGEGDDFR